MSIDTQKLRDLVTFGFELPVSVRDAVDAACDHIDAQAAEVARLREVIGEVLYDLELRADEDGALNISQGVLTRARAALSGESKC